MLKYLLCLSWLTLAPGFLRAQSEVNYTLAFPNAVHHEAEITAEFRAIKTPTLEVRMSRSSPGRYALHEFAKNVYQVKAINSQGKSLTITRPNPYQWNVTGHDGTVKISYTLFGDRADGTYSGIDGQHAHLNMPATLMYAHGFEQVPARVKFEIPAGKTWTIATQLKPLDATTFWAPHQQYLMDSPVELSNFTWREWPITEKGKTKTIRIALHHPGTEAEMDKFTAANKRMVEQARAVYGELPDYDFGTYTFIVCYMPQATGDGMEHRNSTVVTSARSLATNFTGNLGTMAHEYFHSWNVERIRPQTLEPFNFAEANMSGELWFAEGFTSYYGDLLLHRSQNIPLADELANISGELNYVLNSPGKNFFSAVDMSRQAPFVDAATSIDPVNRGNTFISYYSYGSVIALALDLELRQKFKNLTLDDYMRAMWQKFGKPEKPYTLPDLQNTLATLTKDAAFAQNFFQKHIYGLQQADYQNLLTSAGFILRKSRPGKASLGLVNINFQTGKPVLESYPRIGSPLYQAGLDRQDTIVALAGKPLASKADLDAVLAAHQPNTSLSIEYIQRGEMKKASITLTEDPGLEVVPAEKTGLKLTKAQENFRNQWLNSRKL